MEPNTQQTKQQNLCQIIKKFGELKDIEKKHILTSDKDLSIMEMGKSLIASDMKQLMDVSNMNDTQTTTPKTKKRKRGSSLLASYPTLDSSDNSSNDDDSCASFNKM